MATFTEVVAAVVVHSSAFAFSHFGVTVDTPQIERPAAPAERTVARTPARKQKVSERLPTKISDCPETQRATVVKV